MVLTRTTSLRLCHRNALLLLEGARACAFSEWHHDVGSWVHCLCGSLDVNKNTPLMLAAKCGHLELVQLLLETGANPLLRNSAGFSARDMAERRQHRQCGDLLREYEQLSLAVSSWCTLPTA